MEKNVRQKVRELIVFGLSQRQIGRKCGVESSTMHFVVTDDNFLISKKIEQRLRNGIDSLHNEMREILKGDKQ